MLSKEVRLMSTERLYVVTWMLSSDWLIVVTLMLSDKRYSYIYILKKDDFVVILSCCQMKDILM